MTFVYIAPSHTHWHKYKGNHKGSFKFLVLVILTFTLSMFGLLSALLPFMFVNVDCPTCENGTDHTVCLVSTTMFSTTYYNTAQRDDPNLLYDVPEAWENAGEYDACGCKVTTDQYLNQVEQGNVPQCQVKTPGIAGPLMATYFCVMVVVAILSFVSLVMGKNRDKCKRCFWWMFGVGLFLASGLLIAAVVVYLTVDQNSYSDLYAAGPCVNRNGAKGEELQCLPSDYDWNWREETQWRSAFAPIHYKPGEAMLWTTFGFHFGFVLVATVIMVAAKCCCRRRCADRRANVVNEAPRGSQTTPSNPSLASELNSLASLHSQGHITHAEFTRAKSRILGNSESEAPQYSSAPLLNQPSGYPSVPSYSDVSEGRV